MPVLAVNSINITVTSLSPTAQTPIEEFTPTPAFPALQYLESVDEGGVAWRAGLRMGDFLIEVSFGPPGLLSTSFWTFSQCLTRHSLSTADGVFKGLICVAALGDHLTKCIPCH